MKRLIVAGAVLWLSCSAALSFENEAVRIQKDGSRKVELPPGPNAAARLV